MGVERGFAVNQKQVVYDALTDMGISYQAVEHVAVFTVEEMQKLEFPANARVAKNLFLRDAKGRRHFLLVADAEQVVNLSQLEQVMHSTRLSFASEERLMKYLGLTKGSVSPMGILNDTERAVEVYLDQSLRDAERIGVHPNDNTATVFMTFDDLLRFFGETKHAVTMVDFSGA